jgi:hypothetical protein
MAFVGTFISAVGTAVKAGGAISALKTAPLAAKIGIGVGKAAVALAPVAKIGAVVGLGLAAKSLLSPPSLPGVPQTTQQGLPATPTIEAAREGTRDDTLELIRRKRAGTVLTSPQGLLSTSDPTKKVLLGA